MLLFVVLCLLITLFVLFDCKMVVFLVLCCFVTVRCLCLGVFSFKCL